MTEPVINDWCSGKRYLPEEVTDDVIFFELRQLLNHYANNRVGDVLTEYDWRELASWIRVIDERGGPLVAEHWKSIEAWNIVNTARYEAEVKQRQLAYKEKM